MRCVARDLTAGESRDVVDIEEDALDTMQKPRTSILDNHTKLFILLAKRAVQSGRAKAVLPSDIKLPFPKPKDGSKLVSPFQTRTFIERTRHPTYHSTYAEGCWCRLRFF